MSVTRLNERRPVPAIADKVRFSCEKRDFQAALENACKIRPRGMVAALGGVRIVAEKTSVRLDASDMTTSVLTTIDAKTRQPGEMLIIDRLEVLKAVKTLDPGQIEIAVDKTVSEAILTQGTLTLTFPLGVKEDFPRLAIAMPKKVALPADLFMSAYERVARAVSTDDSRPVLCGIKITADGGAVTMAATDSYRLAWHSFSITRKSFTFDGIIHRESLALVAKLLGANEKLEISTPAPKFTSFAFGAVQVIARRIDGQFPDFRKLIPESYTTVVELPLAEAKRAFDRARKLSVSNSPMRLSIDLEGETTVGLRQHRGTNMTQPIPSHGKVEGAMTIGLNAAFALDGLNMMDPEGDHVELKALGALRPVVLSDSAEDSGYLLMPIRLSG